MRNTTSVANRDFMPDGRLSQSGPRQRFDSACSSVAASRDGHGVGNAGPARAGSAGRRLLMLALVVAAQSAFLSACIPVTDAGSTGPQVWEESPQPDAVIAYKKPGDRQLRLHIFRPPRSGADAPPPALVFFHGGGWIDGTPAQFYDQAKYFASLGMVCISVEYRTQEADGTTPRESLVDAKSAMRWIRSHVEDLGIDPDRIAAAGGSAGGHLAAALVVISGFNDLDDDLTVPTRPDALLLYNPVIDNGPGGYGFDRVQPYWEGFSPLHNRTGSHPPTIVLQGTSDSLVPVATAQDYQKAVAAMGARAELHLFEGQQHGFFNRSVSPEMYVATTQKMHEFLYSLGYVSTPP